MSDSSGNKSLLVLIEGTDELLPVARGIGARRINGSIHHWHAQARAEMPETWVSCTGVGTDRSYRCAAARIKECSPGLVISAGTFGAIVESIKLNKWLCSARSRMLGDVNEQRCLKQELNGGAAAEPHLVRLRAGLTALGGAHLDGLLVSVGDVPLLEEDEKAEVARANGAIGVDMETFGIARACAEAGIPWIVARVCVDTPALPLPDFGALNPTTGRPGYGRLLWWILRHPLSCLPTLYGLWKLVNVYGRQLAELIRNGSFRP